MTNALAKVAQPPDETWAELAEKIAEQLSAEELPDAAVKAAEMLLVGIPPYKVAKTLGVKTETIRRWISTYPALAKVIADGKTMMSTWRMARLEQQFLTAVDRSEEILSINLDGTYIDENGEERRVNPKVLPVVAAQARYIIGLFAGQQSQVTVKHEMGDTVLKARNDALEYIATKLAEQRAGADDEPIEATYRVIDPRADTVGPLLDSDGSAPFGEIGIMDTNENGHMCHICGKRYKDLSRHVLDQHIMTTDEYEQLYMLEPGALDGGQ